MPKWTRLQLEAAVQKVKKREITLNKAARVYNIPPTTLHRHVHATQTKVGAGRQTILTREEEEEIVYTCLVAKFYLEYTRNNYINIASKWQCI